MKITKSDIPYLTHGLNWSGYCPHCHFCYMLRWRDPDAKPEPDEDTPSRIGIEVYELVRQLKRGFIPRGNWMMCTSHDPLADHCVNTCKEVLRVLIGFPKVSAKLFFLSKKLSSLIPLASAEQIPHNAFYGATITTLSQIEAKKYQPNADPIRLQVRALNELHALGYKTWISIEPCFSMMNIPKLLGNAKNVSFVIIGKYNRVSTDKRKYDVLTKDEFRLQIATARKMFPDINIRLKPELDRWLYPDKKKPKNKQQPKKKNREQTQLVHYFQE